MIRSLACIAILVAFASHSLLAQQMPPAASRVVRSIVRSALLTDEQHAQITSVVEAQRPDIEAALASRDQMALREALRPVLQEIRHTLTLEQREAVRTAVHRALQHRVAAR
jgi:hypothetical protein